MNSYGRKIWFFDPQQFRWKSIGFCDIIRKGRNDVMTTGALACQGVKNEKSKQTIFTEFNGIPSLYEFVCKAKESEQKK